MKRELAAAQKAATKLQSKCDDVYILIEHMLSDELKISGDASCCWQTGDGVVLVVWTHNVMPENIPRLFKEKGAPLDWEDIRQESI